MIKILIIAPAMPSQDLVEVVPQAKIWSGKYARGDLIWLSQPHPDLLVASTRPSATKFGPVQLNLVRSQQDLAEIGRLRLD